MTLVYSVVPKYTKTAADLNNNNIILSNVSNNRTGTSMMFDLKMLTEKKCKPCSK